MPILSRCSDRMQTAAGWVIRVFAPEAISVRALTRDGKLIAELPRRKDDVFEALIPSLKERPAYRVEVDDGARVLFVHGLLCVRPGARAARRLSRAGGHASPALPPARRPADPSRGRRRRAVRGLGAERDARFRRRRLQSMGRAALSDAPALRQRPMGDLRPGIDGRSGL